MASRAKATATTDHDEIRQWAEERGARPACVRGTGGDDDVGMIRLDFPGFSGGESLEEVSWDDWFRSFDENGLALLHQQTTADGQKSNFNKLIARETAAGSQPNRRAGRTRAQSTRSRRSSTGARGRSARKSGQSRTRAQRGEKRNRTSSTRSRRPAKTGSRRANSSRSPKSSSRSSSRRGAATTRGRRQRTSARGTAKTRSRSSARSSQASRTISRRASGRGRGNRAKVVAMKKTARSRRTRRAA